MAVESGCTNHPSVPAAGRFKQCGKPFCSTCESRGPTGRFCGDACRTQNEAFQQRAQKLDSMSSKTGGFVAKFSSLLKKVVIFGGIAVIIVVIARQMGYAVPILNNILNPFLSAVGL